MADIGNRSTRFWEWESLHDHNSTLDDQVELARRLYDEAMGEREPLPRLSSQQIVEQLRKTPLPSSLVTWKGIRVDWFRSHFCQSPYMRRLVDFQCPLWFIRKVCVVEMIRRCCPNTKKDGERIMPSGSLVDHLQEIKTALKIPATINSSRVMELFDDHRNVRTERMPIVSDATIFISYTGRLSLYKLVDEFLCPIGQLKADDYLWMDIFCVDQFAWTGRNKSPDMVPIRESFMDDLQLQIARIQQLVLVLEEWNNPVFTLSQAWVLWEVFNAVQAEAELTIISRGNTKYGRFMRGREHEDFKAVRKAMHSIDVFGCKTEQDDDRRMIMRRMQQLGMDNVQLIIAAGFRNMYISIAEEELARNERLKGFSRTAFADYVSLLKNQIHQLQSTSCCVAAKQRSRLLARAENLLEETLKSMKRDRSDNSAAGGHDDEAPTTNCECASL